MSFLSNTIIRKRKRVFKKRKRIDPTGIKKQYAPVPGAPLTYHTPWFAKARKRRRAADKVARLSRARNRKAAALARNKRQRRRRLQRGGKA